MLPSLQQHAASGAVMTGTAQPRSKFIDWEGVAIEVRGGGDDALAEITSMSVTPRCLKRRNYHDERLRDHGGDGRYFVEEYEVDRVQVVRFGISTSHGALQGVSLDRRTPLHTLERELFTLASAHLQRSASTYGAAVFDFLVRPTKASGAIESHSAVLLKAASRFLVLDPSNSQFSEVVCRETGALGLEKPYQCYKRAAGSRTGRGSGDYRDCVDIAVKIAFNFLRHDTSASFERKPAVALSDLRCLALVTNQASVDLLLPKQVANQPWRAGQSSDLEASHAIRGCVRACFAAITASRGSGLDVNESLRELFELLGSTQLAEYVEFARQLGSRIGKTETASG